MSNRRYRSTNEKPLPPLREEDRIYIQIPYRKRYFARACHCVFDSEKKLWFTGAYNKELKTLLELYPLDEEHTSDRAKKLLEIALTGNRRELRRAIES